MSPLHDALTLIKIDKQPLMAKKSMIAKQRRTPKFAVQGYSRCRRCGRPRAYLRRFGLCRLCFRQLALSGMIPGVTKASW